MFILLMFSAIQSYAQELKGFVRDSQKKQLTGATIQVYQEGVLKGECIANYDGAYYI